MPLIKRYPNRKLYDTEARAYVSLEQIAEMIRRGGEVQVMDHATGADLTVVILSQIIVEQARDGRGDLSAAALTALIRAGVLHSLASPAPTPGPSPKIGGEVGSGEGRYAPPSLSGKGAGGLGEQEAGGLGEQRAGGLGASSPAEPRDQGAGALRQGKRALRARRFPRPSCPAAAIRRAVARRDIVRRPEVQALADRLAALEEATEALIAARRVCRA